MDRLTERDYFREALRVLGELGSEAMTIAVLCERLQVTKGSFYHHFGSMTGFVEQLLSYWENDRTEHPTATARAFPDPVQRMTALIDGAVALPHDSEAAIRAWGRSNAAVAAVTARVDRRRERHLVEAMTALGVDRPQARLLARLALDLVVGAQQREHSVDARRLRQLYEQVQRLIEADADPAVLAGAGVGAG